MKVETTPIDGLLIITPRVFGDERGFFKEVYQEDRYRAAGIGLPFVQDNASRSTQGVVRGLHYQKKKPQGKLVSVSRGEVFDVAVDIRKGSPSYGQWHGVFLSAENHKQFWVPPGFAHGFCVVSESADFHYKCTDFYDAQDEGGLLWNDPDIGITWPIDRAQVTVSEKDALYTGLQHL